MLHLRVRGLAVGVVGVTASMGCVTLPTSPPLARPGNVLEVTDGHQIGIGDDGVIDNERNRQHSDTTETLTMGAPLQDVQNAMGHADPRTTPRYDQGRGHLDGSPDDRLASAPLGAEQGSFRESQ